MTENQPFDSRIKCIDFGNCGDSTIEEKLRVGKQISKSFEEIGFAYITNHGIPQHVIDDAHNVGTKFFALPEDVKSNYSKKKIMKQGFVEINREKLYTSENVQELRESFDICDKSGFFPNEVPEFKSSMIKLIEYGEKMASTLLECIELGLGIPAGCLSKQHQNHFMNNNGTLLRILHYPPLPEGTKSNTTRCGTHTDYGTFTLLFQDQMGGLEVLNRNGDWVKANPIPGTVLINVGDLLQMWTGGKFLATKHRVLVPEEEIKRKCARKSIVLFFHPLDDVEVKSLINQESSIPIKAVDHRRARYEETYTF